MQAAAERHKAGLRRPPSTLPSPFQVDAAQSEGLAEKVNRPRWPSQRWVTGLFFTHEANPAKGNVYEVYEQKTTPEIDMHHHLIVWVEFLERQLGRNLEPDEYIFPHIATNGIIHTKKEIVHDTVQNLLAEFTLNAKLQGVYSSHCFRRGGAQYRFMYAPLGKRWSLSRIRWWGGWAEGEHVCSHSSDYDWLTHTIFFLSRLTPSSNISLTNYKAMKMITATRSAPSHKKPMAAS